MFEDLFGKGSNTSPLSSLSVEQQKAVHDAREADPWNREEHLGAVSGAFGGVGRHDAERIVDGDADQNCCTSPLSPYRGKW